MSQEEAAQSGPAGSPEHAEGGCPGPSEIVAQRVRELREGRGWSTSDLAARCAFAGMPSLNRAVLANIELGRRARVSIDEILVLAYVLDVAPLHLFIPVDDEKTPSVRATAQLCVPPHVMRRWVRGWLPLPGQKSRIYRTEIPGAEWEEMERRLTGPAGEAGTPPTGEG